MKHIFAKANKNIASILQTICIMQGIFNFYCEKQNTFLLRETVTRFGCQDDV